MLFDAPVVWKSNVTRNSNLSAKSKSNAGLGTGKIKHMTSFLYNDIRNACFYE